MTEPEEVPTDMASGRIAIGVDVGGRDAGVYSQFANSVLLNSGTISSGLGSIRTGVYFDPI